MESKYFYDCEFLEGTQDRRISGIKTGFKTKPTIDLISIGIVSDGGKEYYAISKDFNLKEAWDRFDYAEKTRFESEYGFEARKIYWIRNNVLLPIWRQLLIKSEELWYAYADEKEYEYFIESVNKGESDKLFTYKSLKRLIKKYGKTNKEIAGEIQDFIGVNQDHGGLSNINPISLYGYYSAYDHVALCWLFGKMIDLPKGMPMYTIDLKQYKNQVAKSLVKTSGISRQGFTFHDLEGAIEHINGNSEYPFQEIEHSAIHDARWNKELFDFLSRF